MGVVECHLAPLEESRAVSAPGPPDPAIAASSVLDGPQKVLQQRNMAALMRPRSSLRKPSE